MESLNMNTLASSLPNSANAEKQLMDNFKAAALSITTLYRSSLDTSKRTYSAGYATCLRDVLQFVETGVSVSGNEGEEMTIGRVMDWLEARLEAIKSTEEEEEEERLKDGTVKATQEEERDKRVSKTAGTGGTAYAPKLHRRSKENLREATQTTHSPQLMPQVQPPPSSPPTRARSFTSPSPPPQLIRPIRYKRGLKDLGPSMTFPSDTIAITSSASSPPFTFSSDVVSPVPVVGSKRRHAAITSDSPASSSVAATPSPTQAGGYSHVHSHNHSHGGNRRKRGRGGREREAHHSQNINAAGNVMQGQGYADAMEVEEDGGRERKRVARR